MTEKSLYIKSSYHDTLYKSSIHQINRAKPHKISPNYPFYQKFQCSNLLKLVSVKHISYDLQLVLLILLYILFY